VERSKRLTLIAAILGSSIVFIDGTVVNVALPPIRDDLGGGLAAQQWVVDAYLLTLGSLILVGGSLGDIFGEVRIFRLGVASFGLASVLCALAPSSTSLILFRGLQGVAGALLTPASLAILTATFSGDERGAAIGTWTAWSGISTVVGPLFGGWLIGVATWRVIFFLNVPIAIATLALTGLMAVHESRREGSRVDVVGGVLCVVGLGGLVFGFIEQPARGWDAVVVGALAGGALALAAFVLWEVREPQPMLPLELFRLRNFTVTNIETFAVYGGLGAWIFFLVLYLQQIAGYSPFLSGLATLPVTVTMFFVSRLAGRYSMRYGPRWFMAGGPLLAGLSVVALVRAPPDPSYLVDVFPPLLGFSLGLSLTVAPLTTTVLSDAGPSDAGIASGVNNAIARIAGLVSIAVVGIAASSGTADLTMHGFHLSMLVTGLLIVAGGVVGAIGIRNPQQPAAAAAPA
jgi:EmrB/QacA subfamily drug resistance transporter